MPDQPTARTPRWLIFSVVLFGAVLLLPLCCYQVRRSEVAIRATFGKYDREPIRAGLHLKWPWPIQKIHTFDQRLRVFVSKYSENFTGDDKNLVITFFAAWRIEDPIQFLEEVGSGTEAERLLADLIATEKNVVISRHPVSALVSTTDNHDTTFSAIEQEISDRVRRQAMDKYEIEVAMLGIQRIGLPESITQAVFDRMATERTNKAKRIRQEGEREAAARREAARQAADQQVNTAQAEAKTIRAEGDTAAAQVYEQFKQDPEFALFLRKLEALEEILGSRKTTILIDRNIPPFDLLAPPAEKP